MPALQVAPSQNFHLQQDFTRRFLATLNSAQAADRVRTNLVELPSPPDRPATGQAPSPAGATRNWRLDPGHFVAFVGDASENTPLTRIFQVR